MKSLKLDEFKTLDGLPSLPFQVLKVLDAISQGTVDNYNIINIIQNDPPMACRILQVANAPLYSFASKINSLNQAAGLLGMEPIKNIILTTSILERHRGGGGSEISLDYNALWVHYAVTAAIAGHLGRLIGDMEPDVCHTAGLTHDIGKLALAVNFPTVYGQIHQSAPKGKKSLLEVERETLGFDHSEVSQVLAEHWGFPCLLINVMKNCHFPENAKDLDKISCVVLLAKSLAHSWGYSDGLQTCPLPPGDRPCSILGVTKKDLKKWEAELKEYAESAIHFLEN